MMRIGTVLGAFESHGQLCATHPWEVIVGTLTFVVTVLSMSGLATYKVCGWNYHCYNSQESKNLDVFILTAARCIAVVYLYLQFRKLRKLGSKYLLGIAGLFTVFSSFVFSIAVLNVVGYDLTGFNEALPFFLLLVDLSKACALAKFALSANCQEEVANNIGHGMAVLGPVVTLDTLVGTLVIGIGTLSGVGKLEAMCCFGCLSVVANYLAFMTFYPACLSIVLQTLRGKSRLFALKHFGEITKVLEELEDKKIGNPVTNRVKLIMSAGLFMVHLNSRMIANTISGERGVEQYSAADSDATYGSEQPLSPGLDLTISASVAIGLLVKYIFFDSCMDKELEDFENEFKDLKEQSKNKYNEDNVCDKQTSASSVQSHRQLTHDECTIQNIHKFASDKSDTTTVSVGTAIEPHVTVMTSTKDEPDSATSVKLAISRFTIGEDCDSEQSYCEKKQYACVCTQTDESIALQDLQPKSRSLEECIQVLKSEEGPRELTDEQIIELVALKHIPSYKLEAVIGNHERGVSIRRKMLSTSLPCLEALNKLPYSHYDYHYVSGSCCENVIGYMPVPLGVAGPLLLDGKSYHIPMATTEGCLVASTNRGCRAFSQCCGVISSVIGDGMTRAPVIRFPTAKRASEAKSWLETDSNFKLIKEGFDETSRFARLKKLHVVQAARNLYVRFVASTGDAMGMNMLSKGAEKGLLVLHHYFKDMETLSLSGNLCTDKKPSAINWLEGRGKSVVCEAVVPGHVVKNTLKTRVSALVDLNLNKNMIGSAMAGCVGGFNAHASNVVTAVFIATGQDPAQNVTSSNCLTIMEATGDDAEDLYISCTMPSLEVGTIGGGTVLPPQAACLKMLGVQGAKCEKPGENACTLARIVCAAVMAGELSLMSALAAGHLVKSHLKHNRSTINMCTDSPEQKKFADDSS